MKFGNLEFVPLENSLNLVAEPVKMSLKQSNLLSSVLVAEIDPQLADTAAFCEAYDTKMEDCANCVVLEARRANKTWYAVCLILASTKADINSTIRRHLNASRVSFAPMDKAVSLTSMEYGGIAPIGRPSDWPLLVDNLVADSQNVIIGSGIRKSKLLLPGKIFSSIPNTTVMSIIK